MHVDLIICALQVFLPTNSLNTHWFLVAVNPRRKEIQVLDSLFHYMVPKEVHNVGENFNIFNYKKGFNIVCKY